MKWYFALNELSLNAGRTLWEPMILAAVQSAAQFGNLQPHLIYDGEEDPFLDQLRSMNVTVIKHRVSFYGALAEFGATRPGYVQTASGAFLRTEIPLVETEAEYVLYTDCDILFIGRVDLETFRPKYFCCAPEFSKTHDGSFNTGVMIMNIRSLREDFGSFRAFIEENLEKFVTYDQDAYRMFYAGRHEALPLEMNWKPYWGTSVDAQIVHFHGPKPSYVRHMLQNHDDKSHPMLHEIFNWNVAGYEHYMPIWERMSILQQEGT